MASGTATETGTCTTVEMGRIAVARGSDSLTAILGSCIGVTLYHPRFRIGAMAHVVLPESGGRNAIPGKFADTAVPRMIHEIEKAGAGRTGLVAKMAGGARMFGNDGPLQIGLANIDAVCEALAEAGIRVLASDVGGSKGRRVTFNAGKGDLTIEIIGTPPRVV
jgi:chemotaxis protein CheD